MNENKTGAGDWKIIIGGIVLIAVLFAGIKLVFWGLGQVITRTPGTSQGESSSGQISSSGTQQEQSSPAYCMHCGQKLPEGLTWGQFCPFCGIKMELEES